MNLENLGIIIAIVIAVIGLILSILKSKPEILKLDAETSQIFQEMLEAEVKIGIAKDITIKAMKVQIACLETELEQLRDENKDLKDWADRLVKQVVEANKTPVKMRRRIV